MQGIRAGCITSAVLTILAGIIIVIAGASISSKNTPYRDYWPELYSLPIYAAVVGGLAIILSAGLLYVITRQFPALTTVVSIGLIVVAILALISGALDIAGRAHIRSRTLNTTKYLVSNFYANNSDTQEVYNRLQQTYKCCGIIDAFDWSKLDPTTSSVPDSCCIKMSPGCGYNQLVQQNHIYLSGCAEIVGNAYSLHYATLIVFSFLVMVFCITEAITGFLFESHIRQRYELM
ncbi:unnamed protein product [Didymodactylos carnosus]|uniref:Tetraspanin n=1 Tax=Didymodactylos carnosus TaxID=1234261 RepID=A0A815DC37_9BILA|nr:unnamed protein product [Didymodactylos carnosus]CAF1296393.1 unnamed protein product [Didymodactylos carnosus]CAF3813159.1 unnamed protein product [Didymodactylos carnosus]CAF4111658.1 unnamed protein product [Didymodactylos carnosus]